MKWHRRKSQSRGSTLLPQNLLQVVSAISARVDHPDITQFYSTVQSANDDEELQSLVKSPVGPTDLTEFLRLDHGGVLRQELGPAAPNVIRLLLGNPVAAWVPAINASLPWRLTLRLFGLQTTGPSLPTSGRSAVADHQAQWASQSSA